MKLQLAKTQAELWHRLRMPFPANHVKWRLDGANHARRRAMLLCYIDARRVASRLDEAVGPAGWQVGYEPWSGGVRCALRLRDPETGEWVTKQGVGTGGNFEQVKGAASDAFKRAAVAWGIGRYLYSVDEAWMDVKEKGDIRVFHKDKKTSNVLSGYCETPLLPVWATPEGWPALEQGGE
jgi:hypothetical protein